MRSVVVEARAARNGDALLPLLVRQRRLEGVRRICIRPVGPHLQVKQASAAIHEARGKAALAPCCHCLSTNPADRGAAHARVHPIRPHLQVQQADSHQESVCEGCSDRLLLLIQQRSPEGVVRSLLHPVLGLHATSVTQQLQSCLPALDRVLLCSNIAIAASQTLLSAPLS